MSEGIDYAWDKPSVNAIKSAGKEFVCRYLSHSPSKDITKHEANTLAVNNIWIVVVWETSANRARGSYTDGQADANFAESLANDLDMPSDRPIYFAVDWDANGAECHDYFQGVANILGVERTGVYAGFKPIRYLATAGLAKWFWQTYAWSYGQWYDGNHIIQYRNDVNIDGSDCDLDRSLKDDYGQWMPGMGPSMALNAKDVSTLWKTDNIVPAPPSSPTIDSNKYWAPYSYLKEIYEQNVLIQAKQAVLDQKLDTLLAAVQNFSVNQAAVDADAIVNELVVRLNDEPNPPDNPHS